MQTFLRSDFPPHDLMSVSLFDFPIFNLPYGVSMFFFAFFIRVYVLHHIGFLTPTVLHDVSGLVASLSPFHFYRVSFSYCFVCFVG